MSFSDKKILQQQVGQLVAEDYRLAEVFQKHGIDFCCGGNVPIGEACRQQGVDPETLLKELEAISNAPRKPDSPDFLRWSPDFLVEYIINNHHAYLKEAIPALRTFTEKVAQAHGNSHPEVVEIHNLFQALANELEPHMMKEEHVLFPLIQQISQAVKQQSGPVGMPVGGPIQQMELEHDRAGNLIKEIRQLSHDFTLPADACNTFEATYKKLVEFEADLFQHIHLENNILFPQVIELQEKLSH